MLCVQGADLMSFAQRGRLMRPCQAGIILALQLLTRVAGFVPSRAFSAVRTRAMAGVCQQRGMVSMAIKAEDVLKAPKWPPLWPFVEADFRRQDESSDTSFYEQPRLVYHIDDGAVQALTEYYRATFPPNAEILDICSSWVSHFPKEYKPKRAVGMGMNQFELSKNTQLDSFVVQDLNVDSSFPFPDASFDVVTCVVSVDYLTKPQEVFKEIARVLKPNGLAIMSMSNRCFPTKAISIWLQTSDPEHIFIVGSYFHYSKCFAPPEAKDISPRPGRSDPMYIVQARKA